MTAFLADNSLRWDAERTMTSTQTFLGLHMTATETGTDKKDSAQLLQTECFARS